MNKIPGWWHQLLQSTYQPSGVFSIGSHFMRQEVPKADIKALRKVAPGAAFFFSEQNTPLGTANLNTRL
tara:strand:+ start:356762 stop:356968 length:207 start_codon:yes stop_codon:yes gene_type:complete